MAFLIFSTEMLQQFESDLSNSDSSSSWSVCVFPTRLVTAILSVARRQYSVLKGAGLLTPDMVAEFEELDRLVSQQSGEPPKSSAQKQREEPRAVPEVTLPLEVPELVNNGTCGNKSRTGSVVNVGGV